MNRNRDILNTGRGSKQDRAWKDWTTYENVQQMYGLVYEQMLQAGIAVRLPESEHYWVDNVGQIVDSEDKAAGRFTVMGLTAASGDSVMCIVIITGKELACEDYIGFDHQSDVMYDGTKTLQENYGPGKVLPGLPVCVFRGKEVPGMVAVSPKGSMTSEILKKALETLDELGVYPRTRQGPTPMFLFDGHDSRLQVPFLKYINSEDEFQNPLWIGCIRLPNGTAKWQVGDSVQQNGSFKMAMTREKKRLNLHAIIARGWYYLNMRLLKDTDILNTRVTHVNTSKGTTAESEDPGTPVTPRTPQLVDYQVEESAFTDNIGPLALHMNVGNSEIMFDMIVHMRKNAGVQARLKERKKKIAADAAAHETFMLMRFPPSHAKVYRARTQGDNESQKNECATNWHMAQHPEDEGR
ncbi:unnamed protein product [Cylindrotheca closterium]|uniref:Uncharacterized protein n=1 Tax=Cylindrotheca closterium TaxID=2856 RepID=A0AAD2CLY4_9STRA|nr:unnamed protein product [Cylindrotheca closterium]